jgi:hypothetical protein
MYLRPDPPDLNSIEEFFAELKAFIKPMWYNYEENTEQGIRFYLCSNVHSLVLNCRHLIGEGTSRFLIF